MEVKKKLRGSELICLLLCAASVIGMICALQLKGNDPQSGFTPPPFDAEARIGTPEVPQECGWSELDAKAFRVSVSGALTVSEDSVDVWLTNPAENTVWLKLRLCTPDGSILGETGLICPGEYVQQVTLGDPPEEEMPVVLKIMAYQPDTYYSEGSVSLKTTIKVGK